jgi:TolA-binding protein
MRRISLKKKGVRKKMIERIKGVLAKVKKIVQKFKIVIVAGIGAIVFILTFLIGRKKPTSSPSSSWGGGSSAKPPTGSPFDDKPGTIISNQQKINELNHQIEILKQKLDNLSKEEQEILSNYEQSKNDLDNETIDSLLERLKAATSKPPAKPATKPRGRRITRTQLSNNNAAIPSITRTRATRPRKKKESSPKE